MATNAAFMIQNATGSSVLAASTTAAFGSNATAGNFIIVLVGTTSTTINSVTSITDTLGNSYTQLLTNETNGSLGDVEIWYANNILGGATPTLTINFNATLTSAVIAREYYGLDTVNPINQSNGSATGNTSTPTSNNITTTNFPCILIGAMGQVGITGAISLGSGWNNLTTNSNGNEIAIEDQYVAYGTTSNASFGVSISVQWECAIIALNLAPHGTTTSTSSTSSTSSSISSTSSSISSTSSSISSTSMSTSTSSTSMSTSSTSSSTSSTSSSTSSTSSSSTSSSTSVSSTSSSVSSTSMSSTSQSSTSSSTSFSSTSSSFSSTSSSISSTSFSTSSTSISSTSSSSSTSTTTVPSNLTFTYVDETPIIRFDAQSVIAAATTTSPATWTHICAGSDRVLVVALEASKVSNPVTAITYAGVSMTRIPGASIVDGSNAVALDVWYLLNPALGSNTISVTWTVGGGVQLVGGGISLTSVNALDTSNSATGTVGNQPSLTITPSVANSWVLGFVGVNDNPFIFAGFNQQLQFTFAEQVSPFNTLTSSTQQVIDKSLTTVNFLGAASSDTWMLGAVVFSPITTPKSNADLPDTFTNPIYGNIGTDDGNYFIQYGSEYMIQEFKKKWTNNTDTPSFTWKGRSTESTVISPIVVQIYNQNSLVWETLATVNKTPADTDFQLAVSQSTNISNYYDSNNVITFRVYQQVI